MSSLEFINNLLTSKKPGSLYAKLKINKRPNANISFHFFPKTSKQKDTLLYKGIAYFNQLPKDFKYLPNKLMKSKLKIERQMMKQLID